MKSFRSISVVAVYVNAKLHNCTVTAYNKHNKQKTMTREYKNKLIEHEQLHMNIISNSDALTEAI